MDNKIRKSQIKQILSGCDENERDLVEKLIDEMIFLEDKMNELKVLPFISINPRNNKIMKQTAAAKQYKELSQNYANIIRVLLSVIRKTETSAQDELLKKLEEFS